MVDMMYTKAMVRFNKGTSFHAGQPVYLSHFWFELGVLDFNVDTIILLCT